MKLKREDYLVQDKYIENNKLLTPKNQKWKKSLSIGVKKWR